MILTKMKLIFLAIMYIFVTRKHEISILQTFLNTVHMPMTSRGEATVQFCGPKKIFFQKNFEKKFFENFQNFKFLLLPKFTSPDFFLVRVLGGLQT